MPFTMALLLVITTLLSIYSTAFTRPEIKRLEQELQGELDDEEECLRLIVRRYLDAKDADPLVQANYLLAIRAICLAFGRIESFHRTRRLIYDKQTTLDQVWDELELIPPEED
jgi:cell division protein FtsL